MVAEKEQVHLKTVGIRVAPSLKDAFEAISKDLDSSSSAIGHTLISEFLREVGEIRAKGGRVVWPIKLRVAYDPKPEVRFADLAAPMVAEGVGEKSGKRLQGGPPRE